MNNIPILSVSEKEKAPWNEPLEKNYKVLVYITLSDLLDVSIPKYEDDEDIYNAIHEQVTQMVLDKYGDFADLEIVEY